MRNFLNRHSSTKRGGFTLLELSVVIIILSIMLGGILTVATQEIRRAKMAEVQTKMDTIEAALRAYTNRFSRLPCPGSGVLDYSESYFGVEAGNAGSCSGGDPEADFDDGVNTVGGVIPVRTLGLPESYMFDPWGGRFTYIVTKSATANDAFSNYSYSSDTMGSITVEDGEGNTRLSNAVAVIISHGSNGHGAFQLNGTRKNAGSENLNELTNCHCNDDATDDTFAATAVISSGYINSGNVLDSFDDFARAYTREQFLTASQRIKEK